MGDRANVAILDYHPNPTRDSTGYDSDVQAVVLYTHWGGTELPDHVLAALQKRERWDDAPYLARIVFCRMLAGSGSDHPLDETTSYGISANTLCDNEHPILVIDCHTGRIASRDENDKHPNGWRRPVIAPEGLTLAQFAGLRPDGARRFRGQGDQMKPTSEVV